MKRLADHSVVLLVLAVLLACLIWANHTPSKKAELGAIDPTKVWQPVGTLAGAQVNKAHISFLYRGLTDSIILIGGNDPERMTPTVSNEQSEIVIEAKGWSKVETMPPLPMKCASGKLVYTKEDTYLYHVAYQDGPVLPSNQIFRLEHGNTWKEVLGARLTHAEIAYVYSDSLYKLSPRIYPNKLHPAQSPSINTLAGEQWRVLTKDVSLEQLPHYPRHAFVLGDELVLIGGNKYSDKTAVPVRYHVHSLDLSDLSRMKISRAKLTQREYNILAGSKLIYVEPFAPTAYFFANSYTDGPWGVLEYDHEYGSVTIREDLTPPFTAHSNIQVSNQGRPDSSLYSWLYVEQEQRFYLFQPHPK